MRAPPLILLLAPGSKDSICCAVFKNKTMKEIPRFNVEQFKKERIVTPHRASVDDQMSYTGRGRRRYREELTEPSGKKREKK